MSESMSILAYVIARKWRVRLADDTMVERGETIYQQIGLGNHTCVIHACTNHGEPFDSARHRGAQAVWDEIAKMTHEPKTAAERKSEIARLRTIYEAAYPKRRARWVNPSERGTK